MHEQSRETRRWRPVPHIEYPEGAYLPLELGEFGSFVATPEPFGHFTIERLYGAGAPRTEEELQDILTQRSQKWFGVPNVKIDDLFTTAALEKLFSDSVGREWTKLEIARLMFARLEGYSNAYIASDPHFAAYFSGEYPPTRIDMGTVIHKNARTSVVWLFRYNSLALKRDSYVSPAGEHSKKDLRKVLQYVPGRASSQLFIVDYPAHGGAYPKSTDKPTGITDPEQVIHVLHARFKYRANAEHICASVRRRFGREFTPHHLSVTVGKHFSEVVMNEHMGRKKPIFYDLEMTAPERVNRVVKRIIQVEGNTTVKELSTYFNYHSKNIILGLFTRYAKKVKARFPEYTIESVITLCIFGCGEDKSPQGLARARDLAQVLADRTESERLRLHQINLKKRHRK